MESQNNITDISVIVILTCLLNIWIYAWILIEPIFNQLPVLTVPGMVQITFSIAWIIYTVVTLILSRRTQNRNKLYGFIHYLFLIATYTVLNNPKMGILQSYIVNDLHNVHSLGAGNDIILKIISAVPSEEMYAIHVQVLIFLGS